MKHREETRRFSPSKRRRVSRNPVDAPDPITTWLDWVHAPFDSTVATSWPAASIPVELLDVPVSAEANFVGDLHSTFTRS